MKSCLINLNKLENVKGLAKYIGEKLDLRNNNIQDISDWPLELALMKKVNLTNNQLKNLEGLKLIVCKYFTWQDNETIKINFRYN